MYRTETSVRLRRNVGTFSNQRKQRQERVYLVTTSESRPLFSLLSSVRKIVSAICAFGCGSGQCIASMTLAAAVPVLRENAGGTPATTDYFGPSNETIFSNRGAGAADPITASLSICQNRGLARM